MPMKAGFLLLMVCFWAEFPLTQAYASSFDETRTIGDSFGVEVDDGHRTPDELERIKDAGFGYVRISMGWKGIEKSRGNYDWHDFDDILSTLHGLGLKAIIIIWGGNALYSDRVDVPEKVFGEPRATLSPASDQATAAFAAFAAAAVQRYANDDVVWEIWNEPNGDAFWVPKPDAKAYARFATAVCQIMRAVEPRATIIGPGLAGLPTQPGVSYHDFAETLYGSPAVSCFDALSVHPYRHKDQVPETVIDDYAHVKKFVADHTPQGHKPLPIINSEWGYTLSDVTPEEQAAYALRTLFAGLISGIPISNLYEWRDLHDGPMEDGEAHFGLRTFSGNDNLALTRLREVMPHIRNAVFERRLTTADPETYVISLRQPDGQRTLVYWTSRSFTESTPDLIVTRGASMIQYLVTPMPQLIDIGMDSAGVSVDMPKK